MSSRQPGEWGIVEEPSENPNANAPSTQERHELVPTQNTTLAAAYRGLVEAVGGTPEFIYYPCCGTDTSPSVAFAGKRVLYVDLNGDAMCALQKAGFEAHASSVEAFVPEREVDLLVLLNPQIAPEKVIEHVRIGGHVVCNNYHETASKMMRIPEFAPVATALIRNRKEMLIDTRHAADYLTHVRDDEEFERTDRETFSRAKQIVGETRSSILTAYADFLKDGMVFWGRVLKGKEDYAPVPTKKPASVDDLFMFLRTERTSKS